MASRVTLTMMIDDEVSARELAGHIENGEYSYIVANLATNIQATVTDMGVDAVRARIVAEDGPYA